MMIGREFPDVELQHLYTDKCAFQLASNPRQFDIIIIDNLIRGILSDLVGALTGSLGMLPSASPNVLTVNADSKKPEFSNRSIARCQILPDRVKSTRWR